MALGCLCLLKGLVRGYRCMGRRGGGEDAACFQVRLQRSFRFAATVSGDELGRGDGA